LRGGLYRQSPEASSLPHVERNERALSCGLRSASPSEGDASRMRRSHRIESEEGHRKRVGQLSLRRPPFAGMATPFRPSSSRHRSSSNSTCLLRDRRSCFAISANPDLRLAGTRTNRATLGSVMATSKNSRIQQFSICNVVIRYDTLCFRRTIGVLTSITDGQGCKGQFPVLRKTAT